MMTTSTQGLTILIEREGLENAAYPDPKSRLFKACVAARISPYKHGYRALPGWEQMDGAPWTIGVGHAGADVHPGDEWTDEKCREVFAEDMQWADAAVNDCVKVPLEPYQHDALASFTINCGESALAHGGINGGPSSILAALNAGNYAKAGDSFNNWMADPEVRTRRAGEREQFKGAHFTARVE